MFKVSKNVTGIFIVDSERKAGLGMVSVWRGEETDLSDITCHQHNDLLFCGK